MIVIQSNKKCTKDMNRHFAKKKKKMWKAKNLTEKMLNISHLANANKNSNKINYTSIKWLQFLKTCQMPARMRNK